ncbi:MAG: DUF5320 domain-containing protein [Methanosarcinales archaeon]|nr:DUF5320 domain-containing protein [Methanosarcinales archaeon]
MPGGDGTGPWWCGGYMASERGCRPPCTGAMVRRRAPGAGNRCGYGRGPGGLNPWGRAPYSSKDEELSRLEGLARALEEELSQVRIQMEKLRTGV